MKEWTNIKQELRKDFLGKVELEIRLWVKSEDEKRENMEGMYNPSKAKENMVHWGKIIEFQSD